MLNGVVADTPLRQPTWPRSVLGAVGAQPCCGHGRPAGPAHTTAGVITVTGDGLANARCYTGFARSTWLPEATSAAQLRGSVAHAALEQLYGLPAGLRSPILRGHWCSAWDQMVAAEPELAGELDPDNQPS